MQEINEALKVLVAHIVREELAKLVGSTVPSDSTGPANSEYLTTKEAASLAKVGAATVRRWVHDGRLSTYGVGHILIRRDELEGLLRNPSKRRSSGRDGTSGGAPE